MRCAALLGVQVASLEAHARAGPSTAFDPALLARRVDRFLPTRRGSGGRVVLITGPSGSGKSTLLAALRRRLGRDAARSPGAPPRHRPVGALGGTARGGGGPGASRWLATLARCGLGEAPVLGRRGDQLSEGQRARLLLARAMHAGGGGTARRPGGRAGVGGGDGLRRAVIVADEFASPLDRPSATALAAAVGRWARSPATVAAGVHLVLATAHDDIEPALEPTWVIRADDPTTWWPPRVVVGTGRPGRARRRRGPRP